jgi:peptidyl-prolyl cis-trans isomerase SurA
MRDEAFIQIKQGYTDSGATYAELHSSIAFSAYVPPAAKKKAKVERTRFRESTHTFREKTGPAAPAPATEAGAQPSAAPAAAPAAAATKNQKGKKNQQATEKPGKREKIRYGQAPRETLPTAATNANTENAGALPEQPANSTEQASNAEQPANPLEPTASTKKTRFSARARVPKTAKSGTPADSMAPAPPDAAEVADRQTQSAPLGVNGDTSQKKKKKASQTTAEKTRLSQQKKNPDNSEPKPVQQPTPIPPVPGAPAPAPETPQPQQPPQQQPQQQ